MADPFVAEIRIFPFNFAPTGWAFCNGQLMAISQNTALFSLLGTTYGGNGKSNFALPDLQGRAPMFGGQGPGLSLRDLGETGGSATVSLIQSEMPLHNHAMVAADEAGTTNNPAGAFPARPFGRGNNLYTSGTPPISMAPQALAPAGGGQPHNNLMPYLTLNFCIAMQGIFPSRP
jgi:microcystin-dependent protein